MKSQAAETNKSRLNLQSRIIDFSPAPHKKFKLKKADLIFNLLEVYFCYFTKQSSKWLKNHLGPTQCMKGYENTKGIFRVCNDRVKGIICYDKIDINEKLKRIKVKDKEYLICPYAEQVADESDYEKYKVD